MIYYTGDIHGSAFELQSLCRKMELTSDDIIVLLGDVGANYYGSKRDQRFKQALNSLGPTLLCVHGNHEQRPNTFSSYQEKTWRGGVVWFEEAFLIFFSLKTGKFSLWLVCNTWLSAVRTALISSIESAVGTGGGLMSNRQKKLRLM